MPSCAQVGNLPHKIFETLRVRFLLLDLSTTFHIRHLPHYCCTGRPIFLTWRQHGSLPANRSFSGPIASGRAFVTMDRLLDNSRTGSLYLRRPDVSEMIVEAIRYRERGLRHYQFHNYVIMANHVHLLITPLVTVPRSCVRLRDSRWGKPTGF